MILSAAPGKYLIEQPLAGSKEHILPQSWGTFLFSHAAGDGELSARIWKGCVFYKRH